MQRLPRGRHQLSRDEVIDTQRRRMLTALATTMSINGYARTSVADIISAAGVSRETFYQQFSSKQDCFEEAFHAAAALLLGTLDTSAPGSGTPIERFERLLGVYLETLAQEPALARVFLIEVYAAGPKAMRSRERVQRRFVDEVASILGVSNGAGSIDEGMFACETLVAAIGSMVTARLAAEDLDGLIALREPITRLVRTAVEVPHLKARS